MKKLITVVVGGTLLCIGLALVVLPGPAVLVIPAGLAVLGTEFIWARRLLRSVHRTALRAGGRRRRPDWMRRRFWRKPSDRDSPAA